jgi:hypothetical protein
VNERMSDDLQILPHSYSARRLSLQKRLTDIWFSPLGAKKYAATHMATTTTRPMKMLYLDASSTLHPIAFRHGRSLPLGHLTTVDVAGLSSNCRVLLKTGQKCVQGTASPRDCFELVLCSVVLRGSKFPKDARYVDSADYQCLVIWQHLFTCL